MMPLVSIGLPLYNAQRYLRKALDGLVAQDYPNLELVISDNASTDDTGAICREYAARDSRLRYQRAERNQGAIANFNRVFQLARGTYFMWAAFDDLREPSYVRRCVEALERHPAAVLCCTGFRLIDEAGQVVEPDPRMRIVHPVGASRSARLQAMASANFWLDLYGLIRSSALASTRLAQPVWGFDVLLLFELCLRGDVLFVPDELFAYRIFKDKTQDDLASGLAASMAADAVAISWSNLAMEMAHSISLAPISRREKLVLTRQFLFRFCLMNHTIRRYIRQDVGRTARAALGSGRVRRALGLLTLAAAVYPVQHDLGKAVYQRFRKFRGPAGAARTDSPPSS